MENEPGRRLQLRDAVVALYLGRVGPDTVAREYPRVSRRRATELRDAMPKGLIENAQRLQVTRAANELARVEARGVYTEWELQQAVAFFASGKKTKSECLAEYGVARSTLKRKRKKMESLMGKTPDLQKAKRAARVVKRESPGP